MLNVANRKWNFELDSLDLYCFYIASTCFSSRNYFASLSAPYDDLIHPAIHPAIGIVHTANTGFRVVKC